MTPLVLPSSVQVADTIRPLIDPARATLVNLVDLSPGADVEANAANVVLNWTGAVSFPWSGVDGLDIDRVENGTLVGITTDDFTAAWNRGEFRFPRTLARMALAANVFRAAGKVPTTIHLDIEPNSVPGTHPVWNTLRPDGAGKPLAWWKRFVEPRYNDMKIKGVRQCLVQSGLWPGVQDVCVEFSAFSNRDFTYGVDGNGARVAFNHVTARFRSSCEFYAGAGPNVTTYLAQWLGAVDDPAMPVIDTINSDHLSDSLALCDQYGATPIVWINSDYQVTVENQARWLMDAIAGSN